jgi:hypothetical protein
MNDTMTIELKRRNAFVVKQAKQALRWYDRQLRYQRQYDRRLQRQELRELRRLAKRSRLRKALFDV